MSLTLRLAALFVSEPAAMLWYKFGKVKYKARSVLMYDRVMRGDHRSIEPGLTIKQE